MKMRNDKKLLSFILCMVLIVAAALCTNGCNGSADKAADSGTEADAQAQTGEAAGSDGGAAVDADVLGEGERIFTFTVTDQDGSETVNGITADYDKDGVYWAFYVNDEYAQSGVDSTTITEGAAYAFKVEK